MMNFAQIPMLSGQSFTFDEDYHAVLDYATTNGYTLPTFAQQILQNQFVLDLKGYGIWSQLDLLYVFANDGGSDFARINWKSPSNFYASLSGTTPPSFTSNEGYAGSATGFINTGWNLSTNSSNYTQNDASIFTYLNTDRATNASYLFGAGINISTQVTRFNPRSASDAYQHTINNGTQTTNGTNTNSIGFYHIRRTSSTAWSTYKNGSSAASATTTSQSLPSLNLYGLAWNSNGTASNFAGSNSQISILGAGASLSGNENNLYTAWNTYFTSL